MKIAIVPLLVDGKLGLINPLTIQSLNLSLGTYDEWKAVAEENLVNLAQHGYKLCKVHIDVEELLIWCNSQNRDVDGDARTEFTVMKLRESNQERH